MQRPSSPQSFSSQFSRLLHLCHSSMTSRTNRTFHHLCFFPPLVLQVVDLRKTHRVQHGGYGCEWPPSGLSPSYIFFYYIIKLSYISSSIYNSDQTGTFFIQIKVASLKDSRACACVCVYIIIYIIDLYTLDLRFLFFPFLFPLTLDVLLPCDF